MASVFISYSRKDTAFVDRLEQRLKAAGNTVWVDRRGIRGGTEWPEEIARALNAASEFVLVLSKNSIESKYVRKELNLAVNRDKRLYPVMIQDVELPEGMQLSLSGVQHLDFFSCDFDAALAELLAAFEHERSGGRRDALISSVSREQPEASLARRKREEQVEVESRRREKLAAEREGPLQLDTQFERNYAIIGADHKEYGPLTLEEIRQWNVEGRVSAKTRAKVGGTDEWKPLGEFAEFDFLAAAGRPGRKLNEERLYKVMGGDNNEYGPVAEDEIRRWMAEGRANAQTRVREEGQAEWRELGDLIAIGLCSKCGFRNLPEARFCRRCGTALM